MWSYAHMLRIKCTPKMAAMFIIMRKAIWNVNYNDTVILVQKQITGLNINPRVLLHFYYFMLLNLGQFV